MINEFFFNHFPLYNKFRTPSMWLSLTMIAVTFGAMVCLKEIYERNYDSTKIKKSLIYTGGVLGGICIFVYLFGSSFLDFNGPYDDQLAQNGFPIDALINDRISLMRSDALRTFAIIALMCGTIWGLAFNKIKSLGLGLTAIAFLTIGDMWIVGKRFLNESDFTRAKSYEKSIVATAADQQILNDKEVNFRVFNTTVSSFNDNNTSYFHQSVGGYSAAKLILYQDLIENHLSKGNMNVFNMLNTKYFITGQPGQETAQLNPSANGSVWFAKEINWVKNADEEISKLTDFNPKTTAIIDERYKSYLEGYQTNDNPTGDIQLTSFHPDNMVYNSNSTTTNFAVFSEIWYKGNVDWKAYIDGKETAFIRVNYLLRGLKIPAGNHEIVFKFHPEAHYIGSKISLVSSVVIILMILGLIVMVIMKKNLPGMESDKKRGEN